MEKIKSFCGNYWLLGLVLVLFTIDIAIKISSSIITNESIVIIFIGILATFVVISNYAQTKAIKDDLENKIKEIKEDIKQINTPKIQK